MLPQLLRQLPGNQRVRPVETLGPVRGWNARDAVSAMKPGDARELINWFPGNDSVAARKGYSLEADLETAAAVETLIPYHVGSVKKLFAVSDGEIFDGLNGGAALHSGLTSNLISYTNMRGHMMLVNGEDEPIQYNGSAFVAHGWTDASATLDFADLIYAITFKSRIYMVEAGTQSFWYGDVHAIAGALAEFDLSQVVKISGELLFLTSIQNDEGDGKDDLFVAVFSTGDLLVYQGSDPGGDDWAHVGTYKIGAPLSRFAHRGTGGDVTVVTSRGYEQLVRSAREGEGVKLKSMISDNISRAVQDIVKSTGYSDQWQLLPYSLGQMLIVQAPLTSSIAQHHVRNISTGAWCRFDLPKARSWAILDRLCYMGSRDGKVHLFDDGVTDDGTAINLDATLAWDAFSRPGINKTLHNLLFNFEGGYFPTMQVSVAADYKIHSRWTTIAAVASETAGVWDTAEWDSAVWAYATQVKQIWHKHAAKGKRLSLRLRVIGQRGPLEWNTTTFFVEDGGPI